MSLPNELEKRVAETVFAALQKDEAQGYIVTAEGRAAIVKLFHSLTALADAKSAAQEMMRCALHVHKNLQCKTAAIDLMNLFALIGPAQGAPQPKVTSEESRRENAKTFLGSPRNTAPAAKGGMPWWQVAAK